MSYPLLKIQTVDDTTLITSASSNTPNQSINIVGTGTALSDKVFVALTPSNATNLNIYLISGKALSATFWLNNPSNVFATVTTLNTWVPLGSMIIGENWGLTIQTDAIGTTGSLVALQCSQAQTVATWFPNGFQNLIPLNNTVTFTINPLTGAVTYVFTAYPITSGQTVALCRTTYSVQAGTLTLTSSDTGKISNESVPFTSPSGLNINFSTIATGTFTGTVVVTVTGAGSTSYINTGYIRV